MLRRLLVSVALVTACGGATRRPVATVIPVESFPVETTLDHPEVADAPAVWLEMIAGARRRIDLAEFYASEADTPALLADSKLAPVVGALEAALRRGVRVRFLADAKFAKTYPDTLARLAAAGAEVRTLDVARTSGGVLHAKYFVVDAEDSFIGSQNFDWRALAHIFELGVRVRSAAFGAALLDVFDTDWAIAGGGPRDARARAGGRVVDLPAAGGERLRLVASPKGWLPHEEDWDLPQLVATIDGARATVDVEVLTYKVQGRDGAAFEDLDGALRRAAARGVRVRLLVADWSVRPGSDGRRALEALAQVANVQIRVLRIPPWSGGDIPFARVAHAKFMIVDATTVWVGTSNWERDYFYGSRNVGVIATGGTLPGSLARVFESNWLSAYAGALQVGFR